MAATTDPPRTTTNGLPSPWAQVVKGGPSTADSPPENSEPTSSPNIPANDANVNVPKKTAWNSPISPPSLLPPSSLPQPHGDHLHHHHHQPPASAAAVMGAASSWPALSDSARLPLKSSSVVSPSSDSPKSSSQVSAPLSQGHVTSHLQQPKQGITNASQNASVNSSPSTRQRSMKRGGGGGGNRQGGFARGPPPPPLPVPEMVHTTFSKVDSTSREVRPTGGFASQSNPPNEHTNHRNSNRRGSFGQHGRGDMRNNYHGGRRDQDHGNNDWSSNSHGRGAHGHHHRPHGRGFMGPPVQVAPPFAPPLPVRPYSMVYPETPVVYYIPSLPSDSFRNGPYITGPPPPPYILSTELLRSSVINQIDYYFSDDNLVKDGFLRSKMDEQGWVPITLIASFPRVQNMSDSIPFILDCLSTSTKVEVKGDKIRRRNDWMKWISNQQSTSNPASGSQSPVGSYDNLTTAIEEVSLEEKHDQDHTSATLKEKDEKEIANNLRVANLEGSVQRVC